MPFYQRKHPRLSGYDYNQEGGYFITICTYNRICSLSSIFNIGECERATVQCSQLGKLAEATLIQTAEQYGVILDSYVIMPNHIHAIIILQKSNDHNISIGRFVGAFKSIVVNQWIKECNTAGNSFGKLWQRNYYEHILRNNHDYIEKRKYIEDNPDKWAADEEYTPC